MATTIDLIKGQIAGIPGLRNLVSSDTPQFKQWDHLTHAILEKKLGKKKADDFPSSFDFWPNRIGPWEDEELKESLLRGLDMAEAYLNGIIQEIELLGEETKENSNPMSSSKIYPKLKFGDAGKPGQPGGGGSVFIQAENFTMNGSGRITADGGDYIIHQNELNNFGTINQTIAETINNITKLTHIVNQSELGETEKRQLIGDIETIKAQLIKPKPDKTILQKAWDAVQIASTIGGATQLLGMIAPVVLPLLR